MSRGEAKPLCCQFLMLCAVNSALIYGVQLSNSLTGTSHGMIQCVLILAGVAGVVCQPWSVLILGLLYGGAEPSSAAVVSAFLLNAIATLAVYRLVERSGALDGVKRFARKRQTQVAVGITAAMFLMVALLRFIGVPTRPVPAEDGTDAQRLVYYTTWWRFPYPEHDDQIALRREVVRPERLTEREPHFALRRLPTPTRLPAHFAWQAPYGWRPRLTPTCRVYKSAYQPQDEGYCYAVYNPEDAALYVLCREPLWD